MDISYNLIRLDWPGLPPMLVHEGFLSGVNDLIGNLVLHINDILGHTAPTNIEYFEGHEKDKIIIIYDFGRAYVEVEGNEAT
ncbi:hypothetical protein FOQG_13845 [Fusarium oxysporum f. sp. raphani 54005]|uniref:Uncharacterized protein n=1 Tax=Fusarium oxysporum f. sp. raphani 54005 TaxID=1089458 RepID=X0BS81_FUSOX|nr:hypothetical protein FOQG_13845 [Fusarium oxysporum f. sp. raphani 54005]